MEKGIGTSHGDGAAWRSRAGGGGEGEGAADAPWPPPPWPRGLRQRRRARREEGAGREFFFCHRETGRGEGRAIFLTADCGLVSKNNEGLIGKFRDKEKRRYFYRGLQVDFQKIRGPK